MGLFGLFGLLTAHVSKLWFTTLLGRTAVVSFTVAVLVVFMALVVALNLLSQRLVRNPHEPPLVPYWIPWIGSALSYGEDPYAFFFKCRQKYGDVFTFVLLGKKMTVCLGTKGNDFILNGKLQDVNAEEIYTGLTTPVFGSGVVYDCPNSKLTEQKKFLKFGLTTEALHSHVPLFTSEFYAFLENSPAFRGSNGVFDVVSVMAEITIYTASRSLQGREVRKKFDSTFAELYHDLDMGFTPINFVLPWLPLPTNRKRDHAQRKLAQTYIEIIEARRRNQGDMQDAEKDMIWNLMSARYKSGASIPDREIAHMMIALLMAGQHSSSSIGSWIILRLASRPDIMGQLYDEQVRVLGPDHREAPTYEDIRRLTLNSFVVKETLRLHAPIHSIMRAVKTPLTIETVDTNPECGERKSYAIPTSHVLLSAPGVTANSSEYFSSPSKWDPHRWGGEIQEKDRDEQIDYGYGLVSKGASSPYLPFGAGRHRCIGEQFAYLQLGCITALMVREFKFRNVGDGCDMVKTNYASLFSRPVDPACIEWERRDAGLETYAGR